jgi:hypothetical protein
VSDSAPRLTVLAGGADEVDPEVASLDELECVIEQGLAAFVEVGSALAAVRDRGLFSERGFESFEAYCDVVWGLSKRHANRLVQAAEIAGVLGPIGSQALTNERQARALAPLRDDPAAMAEVLDEVGDRPTASAIEAAVLRRIEPELEPDPVDAGEEVDPCVSGHHWGAWSSEPDGDGDLVRWCASCGAVDVMPARATSICEDCGATVAGDGGLCGRCSYVRSKPPAGTAPAPLPPRPTAPPAPRPPSSREQRPPAPAPPAASPFPDQLLAAAQDVRNAVDRLANLVADPQFEDHQHQVRMGLRRHLGVAIDLCQSMFEVLTPDGPAAP